MGSSSESIGTGEETRSILYIVRHGECMGNIARKNLSPEDAVLTDNGKKQAKLLGELLKDEQFTVAHASDYARAWETGNIILAESKFAGEIPLQKDINLREKNLGIYEAGADIATLLGDFVKSGEDFLEWTPEGAETKTAIEDRIESFLQEIYAIIDNTEEPQKILAVTHGALILHFLKYLLQSRTPDAKSSKIILKNWRPEYYKISPNTGYFKFAIQRCPESDTPRELDVLTAHGKEHLQSLGADTLHTFTVESEKFKAFKGCVQQ